MKREIKFRIWSPVDKSFIYFDIYEYPSGIYGGVSEPQQYTGLKDKNNKEIYEGDILLDPTANGGKYKEVSQGITGEWQLLYNTRESALGGFRYYDQLYERSKYSEVVGNVFENKELLEIK